MSLTGLSILVTGGGSGIGRAATLAYLREGARVTVVERSAAHAETVRADAGSLPLTVVEGDATSPAVLAEAVAVAGRVDQLTCCVGVFDHYASIRTMPVADLVAAAQEILRINVVGALVAVRTAWPELHRAHGSVTLTLSESAFHPVGGGVLYGSSKWALRGVVQHLAVDLAPTVRVNGVAPGGTTGTRFSGLNALGGAQSSVDADGGRPARIAATTLLGTAAAPEDHVGAFLYLADPAAARVVTGVVINSDGGRAPLTAKAPEAPA
ncbi:SDR family NAD(P)-dependent oxidoreductase [Amycolatopsis endophytica]|uniref:NAD(P)-dependent dehydrogenase (Short-subunit alcohol dehydrogenase family) n=1 Tax=Amycolatopsis endophytica TaxID=860233 RepID=A0A853BAF3_9PSEU|nr:SDR family NAD(P)-dependent oxidoreductase [Amycolatopsis endophytica]NYI91661.1 NAD(P)-dependent dehydrogenase (short-subunit alcohol dehydrogenase family) [Amycolatopsis endophytica]